MPVPDAPGAYYERIDVSAPAVAPLRTDIAGFVGIAERGPIGRAVAAESQRQFEAAFGGPGQGMLWYAVRGFFENGGRRCWIVRVAASDPAGAAGTAATVLSDDAGRPAWRIEAGSPGRWGERLAVRVTETHRGQTVSLTTGGTPERLPVASTAGFERAALVRLRQAPGAVAHKVVTGVDPVAGCLLWVGDERVPPLPYDAPLHGFDLGRPIRVDTIAYRILVTESGRALAVYEHLASLPEHPCYGPVLVAPDAGEPAASGPRERAPEPIVIVELRDVPGPEPLHVETATTLLAVLPNDRIRAGSVADLAPGTVVELVDPATRGRIGGPLTVAAVAPAPDLRVTLTAPLSPSQQSASAAAIAAGAPLLLVPAQLRAGRRPLTGGSDGLARLTAADLTGEACSPWDDDTTRVRKQRGLAAIELVGQVAVVAIPDLHVQPMTLRERAPEPVCVPDPCLPAPELPAPRPEPAPPERAPAFSEADVYRVQAAQVEQCERRRDRFALLEPPYSAVRDPALGVAAVRAWRSRFDSRYAALYTPWLRVADAFGGPVRDVPPCGHVAGLYATSDLTVGVHKAPANAAFAGVLDVTGTIDEPTHGLLNTLGVNAIRVLPGRGIRLLGARTVSSDADWRYANVRRLMMMVEKAIGLSSAWAVFEGNDELTQAKLRLSIISFLATLWQQGALAGAVPEAAFRVRCDADTNPPRERVAGRLNAEVAVAPTVPYEFVVVRVGLSRDGFEVVEAEPLGRAA